jgi:hypothetical protein
MKRLLLGLVLALFSVLALAVDVLNYVPSFTLGSNFGTDGSNTTSVPFRTAMVDAGSPSSNYVQVTLPKQTWVTAGSFYTPAYATDTVVQASSRFYLVACTVSNSASVEARLYDYNPADGSMTALAAAVTQTASRSCSASRAQLSFSFANSQVTVPAGHRLKVVLRAYQSNSASVDVRIYDGSAGTNSVLTVV